MTETMPFPNSIWWYQAEIDRLVASGFAELDERATQRNKERFAMEGGGVANGYLLRTMYHWTDAGKEVCRMYRYTTPMAYAEAMRMSLVRHCIHCGRITARQKVGAQHSQGGKERRNRTVCLTCHAAGKVLE
jgi:hypothetical protein